MFEIKRHLSDQEDPYGGKSPFFCFYQKIKENSQNKWPKRNNIDFQWATLNTDIISQVESL